MEESYFEVSFPSNSTWSSPTRGSSRTESTRSTTKKPVTDEGYPPTLQRGYFHTSSSSLTAIEDDESSLPGVLPFDRSSISLLESSSSFLDNSCPNLHFCANDQDDGDEVGLIINSPYAGSSSHKSSKILGKKTKKRMKKVFHRVMSSIGGRLGSHSDHMPTTTNNLRSSWAAQQGQLGDSSAALSLGDISISSRLSSSMKDWAQRSVSKIEETRSEIVDDWKEVDDGFGSILCD